MDARKIGRVVLALPKIFLAALHVLMMKILKHVAPGVLVKKNTVGARAK